MTIEAHEEEGAKDTFIIHNVESSIESSIQGKG
jgi:hypothetical protein